MNAPHHGRRAPTNPQDLMAVPSLHIPKQHSHSSSAQWTRSFSGGLPPSQFQPPSPPEAAIVPYTPVAETPVTTLNTEKKSSFSMNDIKQVIDRMGGIDGIVATMNKVQKVMQSVSQIAPVAKLLMGSLLPNKKGKKDADDDMEDWDVEESQRRRRRRRQRRPSPSNRTGTRRPAKQRRTTRPNQRRKR
ncbi:oligopeptidase [Paenibacillus apiarius]|uniref:Oligopeptidase n=1 Tax=Paenibacillus apiarius TaxID=46240 RepID=A0ABT4DZ47_9BACL|nr:oligopeptidase [Paenibacillus apiarius]MCY9515116.1 oligopeptidase [Paenibacillus apiarius]MCY9522624.1 oligopeptidase [Paenibacillus apiarius]MCY9550322.1 oligopeptidase [Paenibacillus apiarius]MCY9560720.1 oligopeptidase [Paenibacillus apiarius]MCY9686711.1 oligopeptidase [Paenibacillus apiarius]